MECFRTKTSHDMTSQIDNMLDTGILEPAAHSPSYLSTFFLVPKPDQTFRPILNLKQLNKFVATKQFRLFNHFRIPDFLQSHDWMVKLDLSQAYFHVPIAQQHRRFLRINYHRNSHKQQLLQMTCLPFGLSSAPKTFACITNWVAEFLRSHNIRCVVYLDDFLLANSSRHQLQDDISFTIRIMQLLGWTINFEKSVLAPTQCLEFLGITWDTKHNAKSLSKPKCLSLRKALQQQLQSRKWSLKQYQSLMGRLNFATYVTRRGRLHCRTLQHYSRQLPKNHPYRRVVIPLPARLEMEWWVKSIGGCMPIHMSTVTHLLTTDASDIGWGAQLDDIKIAGTWTNYQLAWHANQKEMFAVYAAIVHQQPRLQNAQVLLQTDNRTVAAYINKEGGTKSVTILKQTRRLLSLLDKLNMHLIAQYFPGRYNAEVDALSRQKASPEWHLNTAATTVIFQMWGTPEIDLFASKSAHVVPRYVTIDMQDQSAQHHNAFCHQWHYRLAWLFPPPNLIPRVLSHLNQSSGKYILIAPRWNKVFWQTDVQNRAIRPPFAIPDLEYTLLDTRTGTHPPEIQDLRLEAWLILGGKKY
ncbi:jg1828 [Pararge aegeria aegeria]|uniref:Jg1828 protein n=1 Tax=Pararge aegeria aegeria TaxID=348720 RepID=A0A8S4QE41_9NEOP|nr:jg1828 [Pararge aegeria aegeria]